MNDELIEQLREIAGKLKGQKVVVPFSLKNEKTIIPEGNYDAEKLIYFIADMLEWYEENNPYNDSNF